MFNDRGLTTGGTRANPLNPTDFGANFTWRGGRIFARNAATTTPLVEIMPVKARVHNSGSQTATTGNALVLAFDSERVDTDGMHSTSSNTSRLTCVTAGFYMIGGNAQFAASSAGTLRQARLVLNGSTIIAIQVYPFHATAITYMAISTGYALAVGDYVEFVLVQDSGGDLAVGASGNFSPEFWAFRIG